MNNLKFRAWHEQGFMLGEENIVKLNLEDDVLEYCVLNEYGDRSDTECYFDEVILMQSTGLQDKNGIEIFEGDIVRWKDLESFDDFKIDKVLKVEYSNEFLKWVAINKNGLQDDLYDFSDNRELEVIGNIYENPELLEATDD